MPRNLQVVETGTSHPCRQCGKVFTVERNPNQSGWFCSRSCALQFSRAKIRTVEQRQDDDAKMMAGIRERQECNRVEAAKQHEADLAKQRRKSDEEFARWKVREAEIAREMADENRRQAESDRAAAATMKNIEMINIEPTVSSFLVEELDSEALHQHRAFDEASKSPRAVNSPVRLSAPNGIFVRSSR